MHLTANAAILALLARGDVPGVVPQVLYEFWVVSTRPVAANGRGLDPVDVAAELATTRADVPEELHWACRHWLRADPWRRPPRAYDVLRYLRLAPPDRGRRG